MRIAALIFTIALVSCLFNNSTSAQVNVITPDHVYYNNIKSVKFNQSGDPLSLPMYTIGTGEKLELSFDDLDNDVKNYYYSFVLCNADWTPAQVNQFDYMRGFSETRILNYKLSSVSLQRYTHYSVQLPGTNSYPVKSGNYLLKVYLDSDTSQLAFTRRMFVVENKAGITGFIQQPIAPKLFRTHQKINFEVNTGALNIQNPFDQIKVVVLQNYRWDNALTKLKPQFINGNILKYNAEQDCIMPAGKEYRWIDLRSFRLQTERVQRSEYHSNSTDVFAVMDQERADKQYQFIKDINGKYYLATLDDYDPNFEGDYASVHFSFGAPEPYAGYEMYIFGEFTNYELNNSNKLTYNGASRAYEGTIFLKQGYYNYIYGMVDKTTPNAKFSTDMTEGDHWETENNYTILLYYRALGGRSDELVSSITLNSILNRK
ncbi:MULTISPECIES: type IX secretion system plug protein [Chitinophaga]|uniref:type IX secretion system plug protein n=1 Tax=Chitinophaga TaxID=79328 RepID=UPI0009A692B5|nr:DUF5103 domain-containing protein [Chitinophaga ginsengisegetis]MDR6566826.1 hypothetical protein [Chitinophaga ginsengisegetis]MDR6646556.1 hypothetical protein [Chitinophaga ginsengisegetis]MDR6652906.1 hypothetical protein [Chitinophaga ginsengisegetis]